MPATTSLVRSWMFSPQTTARIVMDSLVSDWEPPRAIDSAFARHWKRFSPPPFHVFLSDWQASFPVCNISDGRNTCRDSDLCLSGRGGAGQPDDLSALSRTSSP